ncbi:HK97-gp10 family putative phage morphogenesis protein [Pseudooceanicola sp. MF1-13]|uniref:HK97-gp10 family putative phage morphogenesis protein n=1 Tax=Pseudooceanicola sp. MF1-13 TaxID=3379095 RepID=UPI0038917702
MTKDIMRFEGGKELEQALRALPGTTARASARRVMKGAGEIVARAAQALAPVLTGELVESYGIGTQLTRRQRRAARGGDKADVEVFIGPGEGGYQAGLQTEFGNEHQAAQPHLRPAFDANVRNVLDHISREWWADIEKTLARRARKLARQAR